jgi:phosphoenolpyruvate carboxylase
VRVSASQSANESGPQASVPVARERARLEMPELLRRDVRLLGELLGQILREYGGEELLADVEALRHAVIAARTGAGPSSDVVALVRSWSLDRAEEVARAFTVYFHLANLAEEHHRVRVLRSRDAGQGRAGDSLATSVAEVRRLHGEERVASLFAGLVLHPVLTAHPTEARRRAVVTAISRAGTQLDRIDDPRAGAGEQADARRRLLEEIDILWRTAHLRATAVDPLDEVRTAMAVFDETLFLVVPTLYRGLDHVLLGDRSGTMPAAAPAFFRLGSWVGGDRDGNPTVTAQVTREALQIQSGHVLLALERAATRIGRTLTAEAATTPPSRELTDAIENARRDHPDLLGGLALRAPDEPHRVFVLYTAARIRARRLGEAGGYRRPDEFVSQLVLVQESLATAGAHRLAYGELQHLIWQARTFGFHLAELEVRQHSGVHATALAELASGDTVSATTDEVLETIRSIAWLQGEYGVDACRRYIISFTRSAADIAAVFELASLATQGNPPVLDVVPLFETQDDLDRCVEVLDHALELAPVQQRLAANGRRLEVMLGYSDSAKDVGPVSATLALYDAQGALAAWAKRHDITLTLFHGRGGALGRGGGPANRAVLSQAPGSVDGRFKVTEQGEVIFARYGHPVIAHRHLDQVAAAVVLASTPAVEELVAAAANKHRGTFEQVSDAARTAYRQLVGTDRFAEFFGAVSPLAEIGSLRMGSRPSRRTAGSGLADLRAIPWVFAWSQTRATLPGWYGLGSGLEAVGDVDVLRAAYDEWPLFTTMLDNVEMSLAKADRDIAERHLALGGRPELAATILAEFDRTTSWLLRVLGQDTLLESHRVLGRAVELRNPYVDALSHLQLRALEALRAGIADDEERERTQRLLLLTVNGVAAGLQNTG